MEKMVVDMKELRELTELGNSTLYELDRQGLIPGKIQHCGRRKLFARGKIIAWLEGREGE